MREGEGCYGVDAGGRDDVDDSGVAPAYEVCGKAVEERQGKVGCLLQKVEGTARIGVSKEKAKLG